MTKATMFDELKKMVGVDLFKRELATGAPATGHFIGRPFYLDYERANVLVADAWKRAAGGVPQGSFLSGVL